MKKIRIGLAAAGVAACVLSIAAMVLKQPTQPANSSAALSHTNKQSDIPLSTQPAMRQYTKQAAPPAAEVKQKVIQVIESAQGLALKKDIKIVALGDSLTQGVGDETNEGGYVGIIKNTLKNNKNQSHISVENFGKRGNRTDQLLERIEQKKITSSIQDADIILITIGANDVMKIVRSNFNHLTYEDFVKEQVNYQIRLQHVIERIHKKNHNAHIYLLGIYNPFDKYFGDIKEMDLIIADWNRIGAQVISRYDRATFVPIQTIFQKPKENLLYEDNFHPNEIGYKRMAERVLQYIKPEIENHSR
ncbi:SGNH/GDSL hydrolase family protein [Aneurinibacillus sp. REN35]|uniref:SGNH/GDSL hydrolase family protein n=1 Tax=Aneurinibacillus sp. REN35 TaxID=3237286 RepID=UPI003527BDEF